MTEIIVLIGFGEAGHGIGRGLAREGVTVRTYDIKLPIPQGIDMRAKAGEAQVTAYDALVPAIAGATIVLSAVVASEAIAAAATAAPHLTGGQAYVDLNSVSPATKRAVGEAIAASGASFAEAAVMARVKPHGHQVPMLLAGHDAESLATRLNAIGMRTEAVGDKIGQASANKMLRSIMIKGIEALLIECLVAARRCGIEERILSSVGETFPGIDWREAASYYLGRTAMHGARRVSEMEEVAATLAELDLEPIMAQAIAKRIGWAFAHLREATWQQGEPRNYQEILDRIDDNAARS